MPTQSTTYNTRVTDEALEKRFRDTFRSQGGAELVDDLYAQGVIVPVVDFTAAATGQQLAQNLQTAWDFTVTTVTANNNTQTVASTAGFWQFWGTSTLEVETPPDVATQLQINDGLSTKIFWRHFEESNQTGSITLFIPESVVFLRAGDSFECRSSAGGSAICISARQIATVSGDLVNPSGFTSS
jgi:hypothetical protein